MKVIITDAAGFWVGGVKYKQGDTVDAPALAARALVRMNQAKAVEPEKPAEKPAETGGKDAGGNLIPSTPETNPQAGRTSQGEGVAPAATSEDGASGAKTAPSGGGKGKK